jgi:hypothetical protein
MVYWTHFLLGAGVFLLTLLFFRSLQVELPSKDGANPAQGKTKKDGIILESLAGVLVLLHLAAVAGVAITISKNSNSISGWMPDPVSLGVEFTNNEEEGPSPAVLEPFQNFEGTRRFQKVTMGDLEQRTARFGRNGFVSVLSTPTKYFDPGTQFGIRTNKYWTMEMEKLTKDLTAIEINDLTPVTHPMLRSFGQVAEVRGFRPDGTPASCVFARAGLSGVRLPTDSDETPKEDKEFKKILRVFICNQGETVESVLRRIRSLELHSENSAARS